MPLEAPRLDDRTFEDIVAEARRLIPRYAPEWTDHNESDPGITLVQLFAWMTEMLLYRANRIPDLHYVKFLQMLGIELRPARPARAELTFRLARDDVDGVIVPLATQVAAEGPDEPIIFETDEAMPLLAAPLVAVEVFDGFGYSLQTNANQAPGQTWEPFGRRARDGSAVYLGFASMQPFTSQSVNLAIFLPEEQVPRTGITCAEDLTGVPLTATIVWEYWDGKAWMPMVLERDDTRAFTRTGHVVVRGSGTSAKRRQLQLVPDELYWIRARLEGETYERAPVFDTVMTNTIPATQAITVRDEVLARSTGRPNQTYRLSVAPGLARDVPLVVPGADGKAVDVTSVQIEVDEGDGFKVWREVDDFLDAAPDAPVFVVNRTLGEIRFGDGERGRIPVAEPTQPGSNIVARLYRTGGGKAGNVGAGTITQLLTYVESVSEATNIRAATGGTDEETLEQAKLRAPRELKSKGRAVTAEDFELLAIATPGARVARAKALPLTHPRYPGSRIPGAVTVVVVPDSDAPNPMPNEATLRAVCMHLDKHRLLTSEVHVVPPTYKLVRIAVDVVARPEADLAAVRAEVERRLIDYLHPLRGGPDGRGWEIGGDIYFSEVYRIILQTPGVDRMPEPGPIVSIDDIRQPPCCDVVIDDMVLPYSTEHEIRMSYQARS